MATGQISPIDAVKAINVDVLLFLFGMFAIGRALEESGYISFLAYRLFGRAKSVNDIALFIIFGMGTASAFFVNDTLAIIGTPVVLALSKRHGIGAKPLLLSLAFAVTIGSVMSPIGNPQNLLIALHSNLKNPFITFLKYLLLPSAVNMLIAYMLIRLYYRNSFKKKLSISPGEPIKDLGLAKLCRISMLFVVILIIAKIAALMIKPELDFKLTYIALIAAFPIIAFSRRRADILKKLDWPTLIFFISMFILMQSAWNTGYFQEAISKLSLNITSTPVVMATSILVSQLISNVPLVALYLPVLVHNSATTTELMALAAGSTIAGNLTILGAASNVIIIQGAEKNHGETIGFLEFARIGIPLTIINAAVYCIFLSLV